MKRIIFIAILFLASCQKEALPTLPKSPVYSATAPFNPNGWAKICGVVVSKFVDADGYTWTWVDYNGSREKWPSIYFVYAKLQPGMTTCVWVQN